MNIAKIVTTEECPRVQELHTLHETQKEIVVYYSGTAYSTATQLNPHKCRVYLNTK